MKYFINIISLFFTQSLFSQVGINTTNIHNSAALELFSNNKAMVLPHIPLQSNLDTNVIPNPATGLIIFNTHNSNPTTAATNKVFENIIYLYNGSNWQTVMTDDTALSVLNLPKVFAKGRKGGTELLNCNNAASHTASSGANFQLTNRQNINTNGSIKADKAGFYKFNIKVTLYFAPSSVISPVIGYAINASTSNSLTFRFRGSVSNRLSYDVSYSGVVYLEANETSGYFSFALGGSNKCTAGDEVREEEVLWEYLGSSNS